MRIATVNVNGIRAAVRKGMNAWLSEAQPDVLLLQEVRAPEDIACQLLEGDYHIFVNPSEIKGRAGVAIAVHRDIAVERVRFGLPAGMPHLAWERQEDAHVQIYKCSGEKPVDTGRWIEADLPDVVPGGLTVVSVYLHAGSADQPEKMAAKYSYLDRASLRLAELERPELKSTELEHERPELEHSGLERPQNFSAAASGVASGEASFAGASSSTGASHSSTSMSGLQHVLVAGDFNIVRSAQDIKNWAGNHNKTAGVLDEEIAYLDHWLDSPTRGESARKAPEELPPEKPAREDHAQETPEERAKDSVDHCNGSFMYWVDVQRSLDMHIQGPYTWWSNRGKAFDNNAGWRIDYQIADAQFAQCARDARVDRAASYAQRWSDHAPVVINYSCDKLYI